MDALIAKFCSCQSCEGLMIYIVQLNIVNVYTDCQGLTICIVQLHIVNAYTDVGQTEKEIRTYDGFV